MSTLQIVLFSACIVATLAQRSPYAGRRPIGYPVVQMPTTTEDELGNRFGDDSTSTTQRLPIEALGDRDLINRISKFPVDKQPFWYLNWQALEAHRQKPQTFPQKDNVFIEPMKKENLQFMGQFVRRM